MALNYDIIQVGDRLPELTVGPLSHNQFVRYSGASGDFNPLHTDPAFAASAGLDSVIAHGMFVMGLVGRMVSDYVGPGALRRFQVKFKGMSRPGDLITCHGVIKEKFEQDGQGIIRADVHAVDQQGDIKVAGHFEAVVASSTSTT